MKYKLLFITLLVCGLGWGQATLPVNATFSSVTTTGPGTMPNGFSQSGLGGYTGSLKFDTQGDFLVLYFNSNPGNLSFDIGVNNTYPGTIPATVTFDVQESGDGVNYSNNISYTNIQGGNKIISNLNSNTRYIRWIYTIKPSGTNISIKNIILNAGVSPTSTTYTTSWSNSAPTSTIDAIIAGNLTASSDLACKDLTINSGTTLTIGAGKKLTVAGNLINNGSIIFKSDGNGTAIFDVFNGTSSGTGTVTVERFIPQGKRAFRLVTPSVTTTTSISNQWQQQTHITGGTSGGFDVTETNNPSMFTYNNQAVSGTGWTAIPSTTGTNLTAGVGYRLLVRGDRNVNLNSQSNGNMNAAVTLSATGALKTGTVVLNNSSTPAINNQSNPTTAGFSLVGNPYVSPIDWHAVTKNNLEDTYYAWDANLGTGNDRGRYVTYTQSTGTTSILNGAGSTSIGRYIQSGQAFFVKNTTIGTAGTLTFNESNKATTQATVFRSANTAFAKMYLTLYDSAEYSIGGYPIDGTVAVFGEDFDNTIGQGDVQKLETNGQNVMLLRNAKKLAVEATSLPVNADELQVVVSNMQVNKNYTWKINMSALPATTTPYLVDTFLGTQTALPVNQEQIISYSTTDAATSTAYNRFKIVFTNNALHTDTFATQIGLYPNPSKGNGFNLQLPAATPVTVTLYNMLGQEIHLTANGTYYQANQPLSTGMYHIKVTQGTQTSTLKWIVE